jgi:hypothetical protein
MHNVIIAFGSEFAFYLQFSWVRDNPPPKVVIRGMVHERPRSAHTSRQPATDCYA